MIKHLNLKTESYGISRFFFYQVPPEMELDNDTVEMLTNHQAAGLLPCAVLKKEEQVYIRYDEISDYTAGRLFSRLLSKEHLTTYLLNLADCLLDLQKNTELQFENILLDKNYIFLDHFSNRLVFIYVPVKNNIFEKVSMKQFFRDLVAAAPLDELGDLSFFIKLHNYLASDTELDLPDFKEKLAAFSEVEQGSALGIGYDSPVLKAAAAETPHSNFYSPGKVSSEVAASYENGVLTSEYSSHMSDKKTGQKLEIEEEVQYKRITRTELGEGDSLLKGASSIGGASINIVPNLGSYQEENGGTTVLGAAHGPVPEEGTTVLGAGIVNQELPNPFLLLGGTNEKVVISKAVFRLGRDPKQADYVSENRAVGRVHAEVVREDGNYYLIDKQSTNGSFLNGKKLVPNQKNKLKHQDKIKIANEEIVFRLF
ncbi:FHA domain-containing protein [Neobacillus dielmonensis]|uniref:FHA domain-containing protein n=1 Tax=Neobacillus dielmonensis TaxID=1347369 RepID=UPI0005AB6BE8|nr:FHA domain-containing protein [Neobacillus dielmonensis]